MAGYAIRPVCAGPEGLDGGEELEAVHRSHPLTLCARPLAGHADAEARRSVLTALPCATLVTLPLPPRVRGKHQGVGAGGGLKG